MPSFGDKLRCERESRGRALEEIVRSTGIGADYLEALERNEFDALPGPAFGKLYIRAYAELLGFDPEPLIADYDRERHALRRRRARDAVRDRPRDVGPKTKVGPWMKPPVVPAPAAEPPPAETESASPSADHPEAPAGAGSPPSSTANLEEPAVVGFTPSSEAGSEEPAAAEVPPTSGPDSAELPLAEDPPTNGAGPEELAATEFSPRRDGDVEEPAEVEFPPAGTADLEEPLATGFTPSNAADREEPDAAGSAPSGQANARARMETPVEAVLPPRSPAVEAPRADAGSRWSSQGGGRSHAELPGWSRPGSLVVVVLAVVILLGSGALLAWLRGDEAAVGSAEAAALVDGGGGAARAGGVEPAGDRSPGAPPAEPAPAVATDRDEIPRASSATASAAGAVAGPSGLRVSQSGVGRRVVDRELIGPADRFEEGSVAWFSTRVLGGRPGERIRHVWIREGRTVQSIPLELGGAHWRTHSNKTLWGVGRWAVEARDARGRVLARATFRCTPAR